MQQIYEVKVITFTRGGLADEKIRSNNELQEVGRSHSSKGKGTNGMTAEEALLRLKEHRKEPLESTRNANTSRLRCEERKSRRMMAVYESCDTAVKVQTGLSPFPPTAKLLISVVGINEIEVFSEAFPEDFPELFRRALHCFVSSENRHFGCGDG